MADLKDIIKKVIEENGKLSDEDIGNWARQTHTLGDIIKGLKAYDSYEKFKESGENDKYKHAMMNCLMAQGGLTNLRLIQEFARQKEKNDVQYGINTKEESDQDVIANTIGEYLGIKYPKGNCDELVQRYIPKEK